MLQPWRQSREMNTVTALTQSRRGKKKTQCGLWTQGICCRYFSLKKLPRNQRASPCYGFSATLRNCSNRTHLRFWHVDWGGWKKGWSTCREKSDEPRLLPRLTKRLPYWGSGGCRNCCLSLIGGPFSPFFFGPVPLLNVFSFLGSKLQNCCQFSNSPRHRKYPGHSVICSGSGFRNSGGFTLNKIEKQTNTKNNHLKSWIPLKSSTILVACMTFCPYLVSTFGAGYKF